MPLTIEDDATAGLISRLAETTGVSEAEAVRVAVTAELKRVSPQLPLHVRLAELRAQFPRLEPTGLKADKAFFDALSGE